MQTEKPMNLMKSGDAPMAVIPANATAGIGSLTLLYPWYTSIIYNQLCIIYDT